MEENDHHRELIGMCFSCLEALAAGTTCHAAGACSDQGQTSADVKHNLLDHVLCPVASFKSGIFVLLPLQPGAGGHPSL